MEQLNYLPMGSRRPLPLISFRTLNGYQFWPVPLSEGEEETESPRVRRAFAVAAPTGEIRHSVVEITASVRERILCETDHDFRPTDALWDTVCRGALSEYLWTGALPPPQTLTIATLASEQLEVVRVLAGRSHRSCH